jgi:hypothetical protein
MIKRTLRTKSILFFLVFLADGAGVGMALTAGPSFDCRKVQAGSIEELICSDIWRICRSWTWRLWTPSNIKRLQILLRAAVLRLISF